MAENGKRKSAPGGGRDQQNKKKKTGNAGKWKTPHQQAKILSQESTLQPGDTGIWVTCARHQENKAAREIGVLFAEYAEKMYGIKSIHDTAGNGDAANNDNDDDEEEDIETAIKKELSALSSKPPPTDSSNPSTSNENSNRMNALKMNVDCLLYVKTRPPVDPVAFVRRICEDAKRCDEISGLMRCRYVNRLTPVSVMGRATEAGLLEVAREVLGAVFELKSGEKGEGGGVEGENAKVEGSEDAGAAAGSEKKAYTFAIRPTIRNHNNLKRDVVINTIAGLINDDRHKVNLRSPDKVILVDIHQTVCGMSVVDGDWDELKRYNLTELYGNTRKAPAAKKEDEATA